MSNSEASKTLAVIALALLIGYYLFKAVILLHIVLVLLSLTVFPNPLARMLARAWLKFSEIIGHFNSRVLLTLVYFIVLVPVSFLFRIFNKQTVDYFDGKKLDSCFLKREKQYTREIFEKTW